MFLALLPKIGEAAPHLFDQPSLFEPYDPNDTVLDWFGDVTSAVLSNDRDSQLLDSDLLGQFAKYRNLTRHGISEASIKTRRYRNARKLIMTDELGEKAQTLVIANPASKRTRLVGVLDKVAFLDRVLFIQMDDGARVRILWTPDDLEPIRELWGKKVMLGGTLQFRPNGAPQVFIAEAIEAASDTHSVWAKVPKAETLVRAGSAQLRLRKGEVNPLKQLRGVLDGQVTDDEFAQMVAEFCSQ